MAKPPKPTDPEQSERFKEAVERLEADGALSPTEADDLLDRVVRQVVPIRREPNS